MTISSRTRFALILLTIFVAAGIVLGIHPKHRDDWMLENALALAAVLLLGFTYRRFPLSKLSYTMLFVFLMVHELGAHYTYAEVPYDAWFKAATGRTFNSLFGFERNHYDRLVHFMYGLLIAYPMREVFVRIADVRGFWGYFLPLDLVMSTSMLYELIEWGASEIFGGDLGQAYLGTQGDEWDAHKDMLLATIGAIIAVLITAAVQRAYNRDFQREWAHSLRVKRDAPLGEVELARLHARDKR